MPAHTPGPWTVGDDGTLRNLEGHVFAEKRLVANCRGHQDGKESTRQENNANARLIAAAPRMLYTLKKFQCALDGGVSGKLLKQARDEARAILRDVGRGGVMGVISLTCGCRFKTWERPSEAQIQFCLLHAAAPVLLEALERVIRYAAIDPRTLPSEDLSIVYAAVALAKGETL